MFKGNKIIGFIKEVAGYIVLITIIDFVLKKYSYLTSSARTIYEIFFAVLLMLAVQEVIRRYKK
jgi:hypothetical protein